MKRRLHRWIHQRGHRAHAKRLRTSRRINDLGLFTFAEQLEDRTLLSATPAVTLGVPAETLLGQSISFTAAFTNNSATTTGYGPYIDLVFPNNGAQDPLPNGATQDGITFVNASYLGEAVTAYVQTFPAGPGGSTTGTLIHPFAVDSTGAPLQITGNEGDTLVVLLLPFGSVTPNQPSIPITVNATLSGQAQVGTPLNIEARAGFEFGDDPLNNPTTDPPLNSDPNTNSLQWDTDQGLSNTSTIPTVWLPMQTTYNGPEDETATGPNFPRSYTFSVEVAPGATITNVDLTDLLPNNLQYLSLVSASPSGYSILQQPTTGTAQNAPNNKLSIEWPSITGTGSPNDITATFSFYVPQYDANGASVIDPSTGAFVSSTETPSIQAVYTPTNPANPVINPLTNTVTGNLTLSDKSLAIQKSYADLSAAPGPKPGDTLQYTLNFQFSDYLSFQNVSISDILGDGQLVDSTFTPTLSFNMHGNTLNITMDASDYTITPNVPQTGQTTVVFNLSQELADHGLGAEVLGGLVNGSFGGTTGTIFYQAIIQNNFSGPIPPGTNASVDAGDVMGNSVTMTGGVLNNSNLTPTGSSVTDDSGTSVEIVRDSLTKTIYAVNGTLASNNVQVNPGDLVTYRLQYTLPTPNYENLNIADYLPLPIFDATTIKTFDAIVSATAPALGVAQFGPTDTYYNYQHIVPTITTDATSNSLVFGYGSHSNASPQATQIDLLFTIQAGAEPFADGLFLTNRAAVTQSTTDNGSLAIQQATQVVRLDEPLIDQIYKGVVATNDSLATYTSTPTAPSGVTFNAPGSSTEFTGTIDSSNLHPSGAFPIAGGLNNVQGGDLVTFAVIVENVGSGVNGAYDVTLDDSIPAGFAVPTGGAGLNLHVTNGAGTTLAYSSLSGGLFGSGIELTNPLGPGKDSTGSTTVTDGSNILVITYDLQAQPSVYPDETLTNTASLTNYSNVPGGANFLPSPLNANANVTIASPVAGKTLMGTSINTTTNSATEAVIGETVSYSVTLTIPEGTTPGATLTDTLGSGLAFVALTSISSNSTALTSNVGGFANTSLFKPVLANSGETATFNLGTLTNTDTNDTTSETITLTYTAVVLNVGTNVATTQLTNSAVFSWTGGSLPAVKAAPVTVIEPKVAVAVGASSTSGSGYTTNLTGVDAGNTVYFQVTLSNTGANSTDAQNVTLNDAFPSVLSGLTLDSVTGGGFTTSDFQVVGNTLEDQSGTGFDLPAGTTVTLDLEAVLSGSLPAGQPITTTPTVTWTSLGNSSAVTTNNPVAYERTGSTSDPGGAANTYTTSASATITPNGPSLSKTLVSTSIESSTNSLSQAVIGETATYSLTLAVPQGVTSGATIVDTLPGGLAFVSYDSITAASGITTSLGSFDTGTEKANVTNNGQTITFGLGDLTNSSNSTTSNATIVLTYEVVVLNVSSNQAGTVLKNSAVFSWSGGSTTPQTASISLIEPSVSLAAGFSSTGAAGTFGSPLNSRQAGDTVYYKVLFGNSGAGSTDAYDVTLADAIPSQISGASIQTVSDTSGSIGTSNFQIVSGTLETTGTGLPDLAVGEQVYVIIAGTLDGTVTPNETITNTSNVQWTSISGSPGQISNQNTNSTERTGAGGTATLNDYDTSASASVSILSPTDTKSLVGTIIGGVESASTQVVIGEQVEYAVTITIPQGTTPGAQLVDTLPSGLAFVALKSVSTNNAAVSSTIDPNFANTSSFAPSVGIGGQVATFNLGTLTNTDTNDATTETITLDYTAVVLNVSGNKTGTTLTNSAKFYWTGNSLAKVSAPNVTVAEPKLTVTDGVSTSASGPFTSSLSGVEGYEPLYYQVTITNPSSQPEAYNTVLSDPLPSVLTNPALAVTGLPAGDFAISGGVLQTTAGEVDIPANTTVTLLVSGTTASTVTPKMTVSNTATVTWTSIPGSANTPQTTNSSVSTGRTGNTSDPGGSLNNYTTNASATFTTPPPALVKSLVGTSINSASNSNTQAVIGETVTYSVTMTVPSGVTPSATITDSLGAGLGFVSLNSIAASTTAISSTVGAFATTSLFTPTISNGGQTLSFNLGDVQDTDPSNTGTDTITLNYTVRVLDVAANVSGTTLHNSAVLGWTGNSLPAVSAPNVTVIEPKLQVNKTPSASSPAYGQVVTYTVTVAHTLASTADANNVVLTDVIPAGMTYLSSSLPAGVTVNTSANPTLVFTIASLPLATGSVTFTYQAQVGAPGSVALGTTLTNNVATTWTSLPGTSPYARTGAGGVDNYDTNTSSSVTVTGADLSLTKTQPASVVYYGDTVNYTLTVTNSGNAAAMGIVLTDPLPTNTTFVSADQGGTASSGIVTWPTFTLNANSTQQFHISVLVGPPNNGSTQAQTIALTPTNWSRTLTVPQFDGTLGTLTSVDVTDTGMLSTQVKIENLSSMAQSITWSVQGTAALTGGGTSLSTSFSLTDQVFDAARYDGTLDYGGPSGITYPTQNSATAQNTNTLTGSAMAPFEGTGTVSFTETVSATSSFSGGSLMKGVNTEASGGVTVIYNYSAPAALTNTASLTYTQAALDPTPINNSASNTIALSQHQSLAPTAPPLPGPVAPVTSAALARADRAAIAEWTAAGASPAQLVALRSATVEIAPLGAGTLGREAAGLNGAPAVIQLDSTADGYGWYTGLNSRRAQTSGRIDLVTVVAHELGHVLGLADVPGNGPDGSVMSYDIGPSVVRVPRASDLGVAGSAGPAIHSRAHSHVAADRAQISAYAVDHLLEHGSGHGLNHRLRRS